MSSNFSVVLGGWCSGSLTYSNISDSAYYQTTLAVCIVTSLLAPMTVAGNVFVLAAIWRNPSLRTPSYVLLAGLALADFCTGLLSLPSYVIFKVAELTANKNVCIFLLIGISVGTFFSGLTFFVLAMAAVERWLCMSRRSLLTVRRIVIIHAVVILLLSASLAGCVYSFRYSLYNVDKVLIDVSFTVAASCVLVTVFSYFKVFRIIRNHQIGTQANQNAIDILKYRKSIFTILYILGLFLLSCLPYLCCALVFYLLQDYGESSLTAFSFSIVMVFSSSFFNPLVYCLRINEIRTGVKGIVRKLFCRE